jgi:hypothetical protein
MPICKVSSKTVGDEKKLAADLKKSSEAAEAELNNATPQVFSVQLEPNSESAYCRVHRLAQNPFLSIDVAPSQTLKFLIQFLENKWKSRRNQFVR